MSGMLSLCLANSIGCCTCSEAELGRTGPEWCTRARRHLDELAEEALQPLRCDAASGVGNLKHQPVLGNPGGVGGGPAHAQQSANRQRTRKAACKPAIQDESRIWTCMPPRRRPAKHVCCKSSGMLQPSRRRMMHMQEHSSSGKAGAAVPGRSHRCAGTREEIVRAQHLLPC